MDGAVGEARFDLVALLKSLWISDSLAILQGDAVAAFEQQGRVEGFHLLLQHLQTVVLRGHSALNGCDDPLFGIVQPRFLSCLHDGEEPWDSL